jgi:hypothetical protein
MNHLTKNLQIHIHKATGVARDEHDEQVSLIAVS